MIGLLTNWIELLFTPKYIIAIIIIVVFVIGFLAFLDLWWKKAEEAEHKKVENEYNRLLKQYYRQYGDYVFEIDDLIKEIGVICSLLIHIDKTLQEIRFDLQNVSKEFANSKSTVKTGVWLMFLEDNLLIHPVNHKVKIYHVKIDGNAISFSEQVADRLSHDISEDTGYKRWRYCLDISSHHMTDTADDSIWKDCIRYTVYNNTVLSALTGAMRTYYDISSYFLTGNDAVAACNQYTNQLNDILQPHGIRTSMTQQNWRFYYNDVPITLEEVIKKLPDDVLSKRLDSPPSTPVKAPTPPQNQPKPSTTGAAQKAPVIPREPILVFAPYAVDYIITQFIDSDFCFDEVLGVADEARKDLTKYTAIGSWVDAKDPIMRFMEVCNNDITFYKVLESPAAMISFKITEREKYQKVHFSMIVIVNEETSKRIMSQSVPVHQLDDADYKRLEQSLLLRRQDIEDKYNLGNFQDYVERVKIAIPLKTAPEAPTPPQSQPNPSTPGAAQPAPTPPPKAPSKPNLSIEEELLNYLKAQPICWEFPLTTQDKALNQFCEALVFSKNVAGVSSNEAIKNLELTIQKKRAGNPRLADHNAAMEGNILAMLYEYSYLMHIFHALDDMKFDTTKVDIQKLWLLIQQDCNARINHLDEEKRKNPTIQIVLDKYNYDHQITRLKVLNDATGREMDYIISFIMVYSLLTVISLLLGNPKLLQPLKPYPADDIAGIMNALVNTSAGLRFTAYSR